MSAQTELIAKLKDALAFYIFAPIEAYGVENAQDPPNYYLDNYRITHPGGFVRRIWPSEERFWEARAAFDEAEAFLDEQGND